MYVKWGLMDKVLFQHKPLLQRSKDVFSTHWSEIFWSCKYTCKSHPRLVISNALESPEPRGTFPLSQKVRTENLTTEAWSSWFFWHKIKFIKLSDWHRTQTDNFFFKFWDKDGCLRLGKVAKEGRKVHACFEYSSSLRCGIIDVQVKG